MYRIGRQIPRFATLSLGLAGLGLGLLGIASAPAGALPVTRDSAPEIGPARAAAPVSPGVFGRVVGDIDPLPQARVYAYQLADLSLHQVQTNESGRFRFSDLPAGLYKIIAHKAGFVPAVVMLTRAREDAQQFLELQLAERTDVAGEEGDDFWSVRDRIPPDVLRQITAPDQFDQVATVRLADSPFTKIDTGAIRFATEMEAMTGVEHVPAVGGDALLTGGQVGLEGSMGNVRVGLSGDYWHLGPAGSYADAGGQIRSIALQLEGGPTAVAVSTRNQRVAGDEGEPVEFEVHRLSWNQEIGDHSRTHVGAQYTSQANYYYSDDWIVPIEIPRQSRSWEAEGSYTVEPTDRLSFQTGVRYRDREVGVESVEAFGDGAAPFHDERLDLFGRAGMRVRPAVLVEYGLYTTARDGSLSLIPQGGLVMQLGDHWQASALASHKLSAADEPGPRDFVPAFYHESNACTQGEEQCYKMLLTRQSGEDSSLSIGAVHREIGETLRLFFNDDFFNHLESLYLVQGDEIPELQMGFTRRVTPKLLARFESNLGSGGGGIFYATDGSRYENSVRYLVTSLDTHYQGTDTGLFISFHHLEQELEPLPGLPGAVGSAFDGFDVFPGAGNGLAGKSSVSEMAPPRLEMERLQLMLTQDLNILLDLAADWAVKLNMEVSRGNALSGSQDDDDELRRRILGGFAVRF
jgi:Carboxypeptidase regulatory-like domain